MANKVFTYTLTSNTMTIVENMGVMLLSVKCTSSTAGSITGNKSLGSITQSTAVAVEEDQSVSIVSKNSEPLDGITITAPSGCTLIVMAQ